MAEQGTIKKRPNQGYAFVSRAAGGGDVFVSPKQVSDLGLKDGDRVEYEAQQDPSKPAGKLMAVNVTVVGHAAAPAHPASSVLKVTWKFGEIINGLLPVMITVMRGTVAALDAKLKVLANGKKIKSPKSGFSPDASGVVAFLVNLVEVGLSADAKQCALLAYMGDQGYAALWQADQKTTTATPTKKAEPPTVERLNIDRDRIHTYRVTTAPGAEVSLDPMGLSLQYCRHDETVWCNLPVTADADGVAVIDVHVTKDGERGDFYFLAAGLRSKPEYIIHINPPARPMPAKK